MDESRRVQQGAQGIVNVGTGVRCNKGLLKPYLPALHRNLRRLLLFLAAPSHRRRCFLVSLLQERAGNRKFGMMESVTVY